MEINKLTGYPSIDKPWLKYYTEEQINAELPHMTAYEYLKKQNADRLELQAIDSAFGNYTYRELFDKVDETAASLWHLGIQKGKIILEMLPVMPHESFLLYAADAVGAALAPLAPMYPAEEVCKAIRKFDAELFFVFDMLLTPEMEQAVYQQTNVRHIISIGLAQQYIRDKRTISWEAFLALGQGVLLPCIERSPEDLLFLASTGGSTGEPKSVMLSSNSFNTTVHQYLKSDLNYDPEDRWIRLWPIFSATAAIANCHLPLCAGMNSLLRFFPENMSDFDKMVYIEKPHHLMLIPQLLDTLENSSLLSNEDLNYIKTVGCGGLSITNQFEERVKDFFQRHNMHCFLGYGWGCTENASSAAMRSNFETTQIGSVGAPLVSTTVAVFDPDNGSELEYDTEGELCIYSPNIMMGYYNDEKATEQVLKKHSDGKVWLHTGDLGTINEEGIVTVKGRMSRVIFVFPPAKIYPQSLENAVSKVEGVREVAFCGVPDKEHAGFFLPVCFIVPDGTCNPEAIRNNVALFCKENLPEYASPKEIYLKDSLPLTKVGKPDIRALEAELTRQ